MPLAAMVKRLIAHRRKRARRGVIDDDKTYRDFFLKPGFFGMPRILLLDEEGRVTFEGDPGLRKGEIWKPADGLTYVDAALDKLLSK